MGKALVLHRGIWDKDTDQLLPLPCHLSFPHQTLLSVVMSSHSLRVLSYKGLILTLPGLETYNKATVIKTMWEQHEDRAMPQASESRYNFFFIEFY